MKKIGLIGLIGLMGALAQAATFVPNFATTNGPSALSNIVGSVAGAALGSPLTNNQSTATTFSNRVSIDAGHALALSNATPNRVAMIRALDNTLTNASATSAATPINADGTATTFGQVNSLAPGNVVTNGASFSVTHSNSLAVDKGHAFFPSNSTPSKVAMIGADNTLTNSGLGAVPIDGDGTATTRAQVQALFPSTVLTNGQSTATTFSNALTAFGVTNYFTSAGPGNTNGPLVFYSLSGGNNMSNLMMDVQLGSISRFNFVCSQNPYDQAYGGLAWQVDHDANGSPGTANCQLGLVSPRHVGIAMGSGNGLSGSLLIGNNNHFGGYAGQGTGNNNWVYLSDQGPVAQSSPTNFSGALTFTTGESQGANYTIHRPGFLAYSIRTNAPGRWALLCTGELGNNQSLAETWDPNSAKAARLFEAQYGDTNVMIVQSNLYVGGIITPKNATPSKVAVIGADNTLTNSGLGAVPINGDGTSTTGGQLSLLITNHICGKSYALAGANVTAFFAPQGNAVTNITTSDTDMQTRQAIGNGFKIVGLWVKSSSAPSAGQTYTATVMTNGVATAVVGTISGASATTASDFAHATAANAQGDSIGIKIVSSATATSSRYDWDILYINN